MVYNEATELGHALAKIEGAMTTKRAEYSATDWRVARRSIASRLFCAVNETRRNLG